MSDLQECRLINRWCFLGTRADCEYQYTFWMFHLVLKISFCIVQITLFEINSINIGNIDTKKYWNIQIDKNEKRIYILENILKVLINTQWYRWNSSPAFERITPAMNNNWRHSLVWLGSQHMVVKYYQRKWFGNPMVRPHRIMILTDNTGLLIL